MEIVLIPRTNSSDPMSFKNGIADNVLVVNVSDYYRADLFVRIEQVESREIPLRTVSLFHMASLCASFRLYGFGYSHCALSVTFHSGVIAEDVFTLSPSGITVGLPVLDSGTKLMSLGRRRRPEAM